MTTDGTGAHTSDLVSLVAELSTVGPGATLRNALRRSLADPGLDIVYFRTGSGGWIDEVGESMTAPLPVAGRAVTPIERGGKPMAALLHDPALLQDPARLQAAISAASLAFDNEQLKAELRAEVNDLRISRARIVEAGDVERQRVERNLHDGAQQRLVGLALMLRLAAQKADGDPAVTGLLAEAAEELEDALNELRELARGLHPAIVEAAGLTGALETLAERPGVPVQLSLDVPVRLPHLVELGAYYLVAEALANTNKYAGAEHVVVRAAVSDDSLQVAVTDDGRGGATAAPGSGLTGLADRVGALGGSLVVESRPGAGTTVSATFPLNATQAPVQDPHRLTALRWVGWETFSIPAEAYDQLKDEDNFSWVKGMFACAGGVSRITPAERDWAIGYEASAGTADWVLEALGTYETDDTVTDVLALPGMAHSGRGLLYDSLRMLASDDRLDAAALAQAEVAAEQMGFGRELVAELHEVVLSERALQQRRYELIVAPALPSMTGAGPGAEG